MTDKRLKSFLEDRLKRLESIKNERELTTAELGDIACCKQTLAFIDSLQEEPVSEKKCMFIKDSYTDEDRKVLCKDCDERCEYSKKEEPASEEFEEALAREWQGYNDRGAATVDALEDNTQELAFAKGFYRGAKWQKEQMMKDAVDACVTEIRTYYKEENEIDFTVMYEKGIIPYEMEQEVKVIVIKED